MFDVIPPGFAAKKTGISSMATGKKEEVRNQRAENKWFKVTRKATFMKIAEHEASPQWDVAC